jgi:hypothetical protein
MITLNLPSLCLRGEGQWSLFTLSPALSRQREGVFSPLAPLAGRGAGGERGNGLSTPLPCPLRQRERELG